MSRLALVTCFLLCVCACGDKPADIGTRGVSPTVGPTPVTGTTTTVDAQLKSLLAQINSVVAALKLVHAERKDALDHLAAAKAQLQAAQAQEPQDTRAVIALQEQVVAWQARLHQLNTRIRDLRRKALKLQTELDALDAKLSAKQRKEADQARAKMASALKVDAARPVPTRSKPAATTTIQPLGGTKPGDRAPALPPPR